MQHGAAALHAAVAAAAENMTTVNQYRADRNAAFLKARARLVDRGLHELVDGSDIVPVSHGQWAG